MDDYSKAADQPAEAPHKVTGRVVSITYGADTDTPRRVIINPKDADLPPNCEECVLTDSCKLKHAYKEFADRHRDAPKWHDYRSYWDKKSDPCELLCIPQKEPLTLQSRYCGTDYVSEGIGDDYKIELGCDSYNRFYIPTRSSRTWCPQNPVLIWAPTSKGKNTFVYDKIVPHIDNLNNDLSIDHHILILSNRTALSQQVRNLSRGRSTIEEDIDDTVYTINSVVDVMTYQSILARKDELRVKQKREDRYDFVICDEAHFFTSDALFNPDTARILDLIPELFGDAIRVYMSATLDESIFPIMHAELKKVKQNYAMYEPKIRRYIHYDLGPCENKFTLSDFIEERGYRPLLYTFSGDYDYLSLHHYKDLEEPFLSQIADSIKEEKRWLIFVDDKKQIKKIKGKLEALLQDRNCKDHKVLGVTAKSKADKKFQYIVENEKLPSDTYALITTSVLDNGVNIYGIDNIVVSTFDKVKCLQMVGRARVKPGEQKQLYLKQFSTKEVRRLEQKNKGRRAAYHAFDLAHPSSGGQSPKDPEDSYSEFEFSEDQYPAKTNPGKQLKKFFFTYFYGSEADTELGKHLFKPLINPHGEKTTKRHYSIDFQYNKLARFQTDQMVPFYSDLLAEMEYEKANGIPVGQSLLARQYSWFGKKYDPESDTSANAAAKQAFLNFLEKMEQDGTVIVEVKAEDKAEDKAMTKTDFWNQLIPLYEAAYGKFEPNDRPEFGRTKINNRLNEHHIPFTITGPRGKETKDGSGQWKVERVTSKDDSIIDTQQAPES